MVLSNICRCLAASVTILIAFPVYAERNETHSEEADRNLFAPKSIRLVPSSDTIDVVVAKDTSLTLPLYKKVEEYYPFFVSADSRLNIETDFDAESLKNKLAEQRELTELSKKLQIKDLDKHYIEFYREVAGWLGTRYHMGSMSRDAVDCSGFTKIIYNIVFNKDIPRTSRDMSNSLTESLTIDELHPGDLVFFATRGKKYVNHVGMYLGEGHFVHASVNGVKVSPLTDGYYKKTWRMAGRIDGE